MENVRLQNFYPMASVTPKNGGSGVCDSRKSKPWRPGLQKILVYRKHWILMAQCQGHEVRFLQVVIAPSSLHSHVEF